MLNNGVVAGLISRIEFRYEGAHGEENSVRGKRHVHNGIVLRCCVRRHCCIEIFFMMATKQESRIKVARAARPHALTMCEEAEDDVVSGAVCYVPSTKKREETKFNEATQA